MCKYEFGRHYYLYEQVGTVFQLDMKQIDYMNPSRLVVSMAQQPAVVAQLYKPDLLWYIHNILLASEERQHAFASVFLTHDNQSLTNHIIANSSRLKYSRGDFIFTQDEVSKGVVFLVVRGEIQLETYAQKPPVTAGLDSFEQESGLPELNSSFQEFYSERGHIYKRKIVSDPTALNSIRTDIRVCPAGTLLGIEMLNRLLTRSKLNKSSQINNKYICAARVLTADSVIYKLRLDYVSKLDGILGKERWLKFRDFLSRTESAIRRQLNKRADDLLNKQETEGVVSLHLNQECIEHVTSQVTRNKIPFEPDISKMDLSNYDHGK